MTSNAQVYNMTAFKKYKRKRERMLHSADLVETQKGRNIIFWMQTSDTIDAIGGLQKMHCKYVPKIKCKTINLPKVSSL